ncbi:MAG: hypothetical protein Q8K78_00385 [Planctomycetaceae bacterium]|nr:hypothetical protein [Planctomycetaceae bacterium]
MELNPNHAVTQELREHWHKIAALLMWKLRQSKVTITIEDIGVFDAVPDASMPTIIVHYHKDSMDILLMPIEEAQRYAAKLGEQLSREPQC